MEIVPFLLEGFDVSALLKKPPSPTIKDDTNITLYILMSLNFYNINQSLHIFKCTTEWHVEDSKHSKPFLLFNS